MTLPLVPDPQQLVGLELTIARLAADMRVFGFGPVRPGSRGGTVASFALHLQCPWRLDGPDGTITGADDLYHFAGVAPRPENWTWEHGDSLQQQQLDIVLGPRLGEARAWYYASRIGVAAVQLEPTLGDLVVSLTSDYVLRVFPAGTASEQWRLLRCDSCGEHLVYPDLPD